MQSKLQLQRVFMKAFFVVSASPSRPWISWKTRFLLESVSKEPYDCKLLRMISISRFEDPNALVLFSEPCIPFHHRGFVLSPPMAVPKQVQCDGNSKVLQCQQGSYADQEQSPGTADL